MRLKHRIADLLGGRPAPAGTPASVPVDAATARLRDPRLHQGPAAEAGVAPAAATGALADGPPGGEPPDRPGTAAADPVADPCAAPRATVQDACALSDRMSALAMASDERLREARRAYDEHAGRRERAVATADPRAIRASKDEAQATFRRARIAASDRAALESAAREWLREIDRINARGREAARVIGREDTAEAGLLRAVERLGIEADGARIAAESAAEACRNARITLANCEETERLGLGRLPSATTTLTPASAVARATLVVPGAGPVGPAGGRAAAGPEAAGAEAAGAEEAAGLPVQAGEPAILPLLAGDRQVMLRVAAALAEGDQDAERRWQIQLAGFVDAVNARAIDSAVLVFPGEHMFWGPFNQLQCREIAAALAALGYRYDGMGGFADGRVPGQRELSLAIGYAGLDPMRIRFWPNEAELPDLFADVQVDSGRFVAEAAGDLTLGEMIDLLGRRAEELSDLWNAWGRVRPLLLSPA